MRATNYFLTILLAVMWLPGLAGAAEDAAPTTGSGMLAPAYLLEVPDTVTDILIADAETATMHRFVRTSGGVIKRDQRYMSVGQNGMGKQRAWDKKTPLGVYFITERLDTSKLHDKYGVAAFPLDYPNAWDLYNNRTGDGIWLHGVDHKNPNRPPLDTDGCLSLPNEEILVLADRLQPLVTPVIVARHLEWADPEQLQGIREEFRLALDIWRQSQQQGDAETYLSLYADDFRYQGMDRQAWAAWRAGVFAINPLREVQISNLLLVADPEVGDLFLSRFTQLTVTKSGPVKTTKRLYWRRSEDHSWRIVSEGAG